MSRFDRKGREQQKEKVSIIVQQNGEGREKANFEGKRAKTG